MSLLPDYSRQAERYDQTRGASPSVLGPLREALAGVPGQRLADVGGGTGNYSRVLRDEGWKPVVVDRSPEMPARAAAKGLQTVQADAQHLPFAAAAFDAVVMISMLHHVEDQPTALAEARRVLKREGRLVLMGFTAEDSDSLWILDYFPSSRGWMEATHPPRSAFLAALPGARLTAFRFSDMEDASLAALSADPERVLKAADRGDTTVSRPSPRCVARKRPPKPGGIEHESPCGHTDGRSGGLRRPERQFGGHRDGEGTCLQPRQRGGLRR